MANGSSEDVIRALIEEGRGTLRAGVEAGPFLGSIGSSLQGLRALAQNPRAFISPQGTGPFGTVLDLGVTQGRRGVEAVRPSQTTQGASDVLGKGRTAPAAHEAAARNILKRELNADVLTTISDDMWLVRRPIKASQPQGPQEFALVAESSQGAPLVLNTGDDAGTMLKEAMEEGFLTQRDLKRVAERLSQKGAL